MISFSMPRTTFVAVAAVAVALSALAGCKDTPNSEDGAPVPISASASAPTSAPASASAVPVAGAFEPEAALAGAGKKPYAATMKATTELAGREAATTSGRGNFETVFTGRMEVRSTDSAPGMWLETVTTVDGNYVRDRSRAGGTWVKMPRSADNQASYVGYAELLLATGPSAKKGMEDQGGVPVYHLAGRLDIDQVASVDPRTHRSMKAKGVTGFDCDQWIDSQGRTLRFDQHMDMRGTPGANKVLFGEFGPVETFDAPVAR
ncbi:hypothetical protein ABTX85_37035 [Streptomyces sp. NPDC096097]|uniref:hypothetical protein n=1 Tax=Streptomyces sp. NPDC096097 TaxID=3155546 RepID=UPI003324D13C